MKLRGKMLIKVVPWSPGYDTHRGIIQAKGKASDLLVNTIWLFVWFLTSLFDQFIKPEAVCSSSYLISLKFGLFMVLELFPGTALFAFENFHCSFILSHLWCIESWFHWIYWFLDFPVNVIAQLQWPRYMIFPQSTLDTAVLFVSLE
jgi:hypothetical protein